MKDVTGGRLGGDTFQTHRVDDIKAVLSRYGIQRFRYHTWDDEVRGADGETRLEPIEFAQRAKDYFQRGAMSRSNRPSDNIVGSPGPDAGFSEDDAEVRRGLPVDEKQDEGVLAGGGARFRAGVSWELPGDLIGIRLPIFQSMKVPAAVVAALSLGGGSPTVSEVGEGEPVPDTPIGEGDVRARASKVATRGGAVLDSGDRHQTATGPEPRKIPWSGKSPASESALNYFSMRRQHE